MPSFLAVVGLLLVRLWHRLCPLPCPALPAAEAVAAPRPERPRPTPRPAPPPEPEAPAEAAAAAAAPSLEDRLYAENPSLHRLYRRVCEYIERYGVCTASNPTLCRDFFGPGESMCKRQVQRHLVRLVELDAIEIFDVPQHVIRTGRAIRLPSQVPASQLQLRLGDARPRRLTAGEVERGRADPPAPFVERRRPPQAAGGVTSASPVTPTHVTGGMSPDLGSGSRTDPDPLRDRDRREGEGSPSGEAGKEAASRGATDGTPVYSLDEKRLYRQKAAERRSRWTETFLAKDEHRLPLDVCRQVLDAIAEKAPDGQVRGYLYATLEEREIAAGRLKLPPRPAAPPSKATPAREAAAELVPDLPPAPPPCPAAAALWESLQTPLVGKVGQRLHDLWLAHLVPVALDDTALTLWAATQAGAEWVVQRYTPLVEELLLQSGRALALRLVAGEAQPEAQSA